MLSQIIITLLVALAGGLLFQTAVIPLAWILGPLVAVMLWKRILKQAVCWPVLLRNGGLVIVGYRMGLDFSTETVQQIFKQLPGMLLSTLSIVIFSLCLGYFISCRLGVDLSSGLIGSIPGGLTQMVVFSEEVADADTTIVTFMQTFRLLAVIFIVPFLAFHGLTDGVNQSAIDNSFSVATASSPGMLAIFIGITLLSVGIALKIHLPMPYLLGPMLGVACLIMAGLSGPDVPPFLVVAAQLSIGAHLGLTVQPADLPDWKRFFPYVFLSAVGIVLFSLLIGYLLTYLYPIGLLTAFLSTAPGGMAEMGLTAVAVHADLATVTAYQLFRIVFILFAVPTILKRLLYYIK